MSSPGSRLIWSGFKDFCVFIVYFLFTLRTQTLSSLQVTLFYSVSSCNRMNITVGWISCGETNSRGSARRSKPWRTSTGFCWRTSCPRTWPSTFWAATGKTRWAPRFVFFFSCLYCLLTLRGPLSLLPEQTLHSCSSSVILSSAAEPLVALPPHISSILTSVSLSESNYFFPAAVTALSGMIKLSSYVFLDSVSPLGL